MELFNSYSLLQENTISVLRNYPRFLTLLKCMGSRFDNLEDCINYLCEKTQKDTADGIWLDYVGWLVGKTRADYVDISNYFCVNAEDVNVSKYFYFPTSMATGTSSNLDDSLYRIQIDGKIAYNISNGSRESNIRVIRGVTNADRVIIYNYAPMLLDIVLYGYNLIDKNNLIANIEKVLGNGIGVHALDYYDISYEQIEEQINTILEITGIEGDYTDYDYEDIDSDLDYILEIGEYEFTE